MKEINISNLTKKLSEKYGINLRGYLLSDRIELRPIDIEYGVGFIIKIKIEWRNLSAEFIPDNFSGRLINTMGASEKYKRNIFRLIATNWSLNNAIYMKVNGEEVNAIEPDHWRDNWSHLYIQLCQTPVIKDELDTHQLENLIIDISGCLLGLILSLLPLEEATIEEGTDGLPEGALTRIEVNRYERSSVNRQACLSIHGHSCKVCNFDFEDKYGEIGKGYIHVHHIVPVSEIGLNYNINPEKDLVPVCPNCHVMLHKKNPAYTVNELKSIISSNMKIRKG
ncbi:HNH endonuclease [Evansella clarkii]|uniref:HNH endonuclease n=1 Tax=Evansella clarkii TaxID=79879 RepID=UPI001EEE2158|nr:HNH endonuclease [Evansella clarkii]